MSPAVRREVPVTEDVKKIVDNGKDASVGGCGFGEEMKAASSGTFFCGFLFRFFFLVLGSFLLFFLDFVLFSMVVSNCCTAVGSCGLRADCSRHSAEVARK